MTVQNLAQVHAAVHAAADRLQRTGGRAAPVREVGEAVARGGGTPGEAVAAEGTIHRVDPTICKLTQQFD